MSFFKYIIPLIALIAATSCSESDIIEKGSISAKNKIQVIARVTPFADRDVSSRAIKVGEETNISSIWLAIFDGQECKNLIADNNTVFEIDGTNLQEGFDLYIFANVDLTGFKNKKEDGDTANDPTLDDFLGNGINVSGIDIPVFKDKKCFPMIGSLKNFNPEDYRDAIIEIPLYALYAKIVMDIGVRPDQEIEGGRSARFRLNGYKVYNVPTMVDGKGRNVGSNDLTISDPVEVFDSEEIFITQNNLAQGANSVRFSFYLPERFLQPVDSAAIYPYPFPKVNGNYRDEDLKYRQRFKPSLVEKNNPPATFVQFFGVYTDHQGHNYNVSYDIYVGSDNYNNFDIARNTQYNNNITIRGILNADDQNAGTISVDHRVNIERVNPIIINLRRETLFDSHFEVRPLRIRKNKDFVDEDLSNAKVKVEVLGEDGTVANRPDWIRIEHKNDNTGENGDWYLPNGKRKYFTYNLVSGKSIDGTTEDSSNGSLVGSHTIENIPVDGDGECIWIYVDEAKKENAKDDVRSAKLRVSFTLDGENYSSDHSVDYIINQRELFPVTYTNGTPNNTNDDYSYLIEYHEEYLHDYDAEDEYGQTEFEGMEWGLDGAQLSFDKTAVVFDSGGDWISNLVDGLINGRVQGLSPFYDFYIDKYDSETMPTQSNRSNRNGYEFCDQIISDINTKVDEGRKTNYPGYINTLTLGEEPKSAIEYCYNKNKRNINGEVVDVQWYLPAIDEMEDIVMSTYTSEGSTHNTYSRFLEFQEKFYWSCQPAYKSNLAHYAGTWLGVFTRFDEKGNLYYDHVNHARATSVSYKDGNYSPKTSGTTGYEMVYMFEQDDLEIYNVADKLGNNDSFTYEYQISALIGGTRTYSNTIDRNDLIKLEEGHHPRTKKNRIRCVRKQ